MAVVDTPVGGTNGTTPAEPHPIDPCFLTAEAIDDYFKYASTEAGAEDPRFRLFRGTPDWSKDAFPLALCEFLAYKSVLAYEKDPTIAKNLSRENCRGVKEGSYQAFDSRETGGDTFGFGFVLDDTAFIVMRGTASLRDWIDDATAVLTSSLISKRTRDLIGDPSPPRHLGFARAWGRVVPIIDKWVDGLPKDIPFCFSGHSLGGALAILGAHDFAKKKRHVAAVVTFAAPKVGEKAFANDYDLKLKNRTLRLESDEDDVPWLAISRDYTHVGCQWKFDQRPMIGGWEKFWAALLGIAGWTRDKTVSSKEPADTKPVGDPGGSKKVEENQIAPVTKERTGGREGEPAEPVDQRKALQVILVIVAAIVVFLVTRKFIIRYRAHGAAKRYALYLSTLSYQKIRELRSDDYERASRELDAHLAYIRGKDGSVYKALKNRPIRITKKNAVQFRDEKGYERYIW